MTMTEWQIRMSQAGIEPEEPIVEPWPAWKVRMAWAGVAIFLVSVWYGAYWVLA